MNIIYENLLIFWLIIMIIALIVEAFSLALVTIWFAGGALVAGISTFFVDSFAIQLVIFLVISVCLLVFTRPLFSKNKHKGDSKTNVDSLIGKEGKIIKSCDSSPAQAKVGFQIWTVQEENGLELKEGDSIIVISVEGVKLIVNKEGV